MKSQREMTKVIEHAREAMHAHIGEPSLLAIMNHLAKIQIILLCDIAEMLNEKR